MNHSFDVEIAKKYGVPVAIVLNNIVFWIEKNKANDKHFYDGRYWTYNSIKAFQELFPYWTFKQMRNVLDKLIESGLVVTGNYNKTTYDQTIWYGLSAEAMILFNMTSPVDNSLTICPKGQMASDAACKATKPLEPAPLPICPKGQMEVTKRANGFDQKGKPIPDIKTDIKPNDKSFCSSTEQKKDNAKKHDWANQAKSSGFANVESQSTSYDPLRKGTAEKASTYVEEYMNKKTSHI